MIQADPDDIENPRPSLGQPIRILKADPGGMVRLAGLVPSRNFHRVTTICYRAGVCHGMLKIIGSLTGHLRVRSPLPEVQR